MNDPARPASQPGGQPAADRGDPANRSSRRRIVVTVLVAAVLLVSTVLVVRTTRWWGCTFPPDDQAAAVTAYQSDPAFSLAPPSGRLVDEVARTRACDYRPGSREREQSAGPQFATVWRQYAVDRIYPKDDLVALVEPGIEAAGWRVVTQRGDAGGSFLRYCKRIGTRATWLEVSTTANGTSDGVATFTLLIDGRPDDADC